RGPGDPRAPPLSPDLRSGPEEVRRPLPADRAVPDHARGPRLERCPGAIFQGQGCLRPDSGEVAVSGSAGTPPPNPLPEAERGSQASLLPLSASGRGPGGGVLNSPASGREVMVRSNL